MNERENPQSKVWREDNISVSTLISAADEVGKPKLASGNTVKARTEDPPPLSLLRERTTNERPDCGRDSVRPARCDRGSKFETR